MKNNLTVLISELLSKMPLLLAVAVLTCGGERILQMANSRHYFTAYIENRCSELHLASGMYCASCENCHLAGGQQYSMITEGLVSRGVI